MSTPKQIMARRRNWYIMKTTGMITEIDRIHLFCSNPKIKEKACDVNKAIKALQKTIIDSKTEDWDG